MKKILDFIVEQQVDSIEDLPKLVQPISTKFNLDIGIAEAIINTVIDWECSSTPESLERILNRKFPSIVTN